MKRRKRGVDISPGVETLAAWCGARGRRINGAARADYVLDVLQMAHARAK